MHLIYARDVIEYLTVMLNAALRCTCRVVGGFIQARR